MARLALPLLLLLAPALRAQEAEDLLARADALVHPYVESKAFVGVAVGMIAPDGRVFMKGYGKVSKDGDAVPTADTVYEIGSVSKAFTGILLAHMVNAGTVKLEQPVQELLPECKVPKFGDRQITLLDLATQTSGLPRMPNNFSPKDPRNPYADYTVEQAYAFMGGHALERSPGMKYAYSNLGVGMLGHALAVKAGKSYEDVLVLYIAGPLEMKDTRVQFTDAMRKRLAPPYNAVLMPVHNWDIPTFAGAGGIRSTVRDMIRFLQANLGADASMALARKMHYSRGQRMGLGWHLRGNGACWHNGGTGGYASYTTVNPKRNVAVVVLANTSTREVDVLGDQLARMLYGEKVLAKQFKVSAELLAEYVGQYTLMPGVTLTLTGKDGFLVAQVTGQPAVPVFARNDRTFYYRVAPASFTMTRDDKGKVDGLVFKQGGNTLTAKRE